MDEDVKNALQKELVIDITTKGRKSGVDRRIEIWFHNIDGDIYITGSPGTRSWYANMLADPEFTFHLKQSVKADLSANAKAITDKADKSKILKKILPTFYSVGATAKDLKRFVDGSPLVKVTFND